MSPPCALIDLDALRHNLGRAKSYAPGTRVMAVIKADAYGHGAVDAARALQGAADALGVARVDEGAALRRAGIGGRIVVLEGFNDADELAAADGLDLDVAIHHPAQLALLEGYAARRGLTCWLKVDSGMHRLGVPAGDAAAIHRTLARLPGVRRVEALMTHLASADDPDDPATGRQLARFDPLAAELGGEVSIANSAAVIAWPAARRGWVRPGIMLYGASPFTDRPAAAFGLRPVMTLESRLIAINHYPAGACIGYGGTWCCPEPMPVGVVAIGYGDGYPRHLPSGTPLLVNGRRVPLVGRVSMDKVTVDLRNQPEARVGDPVRLWGEGLPVDEIAALAGTIAYELLCRVTGRVAFRLQGGAG